jgi:hypothetical protein
MEYENYRPSAISHQPEGRMIMNGFGALWRIRTRNHIRTRRSIPTSTGPAWAAWPRLQETEHLMLEEERLQARRALHERRRACGVPLLWP